VLFDDGGPAHTSDDAVVPVLGLGPLLNVHPRAAEQPGDGGPCLHPAAPRPRQRFVLTFARQAGHERFDQRVRHWEGEFAARSREDCLLRALLRAAGLGRNTEPYAALADALDGTTLDALLAPGSTEAALIAPAVLLGMAGLLEQARAGEEVRATWARYRNYWPGRPLDARQWQRFRLRLPTYPKHDWRHSPQWWQVTDCADCWKRAADLVDTEPAPTTAALVALLSTGTVATGAPGAWKPGPTCCCRSSPPMATPRCVSRVTHRATALYATLPGGGDNQKLETMRAIGGLPALPRLAIEQQGLLEIWTRYCSTQHCLECPLAPHGANGTVTIS